MRTVLLYVFGILPIFLPQPSLVAQFSCSGRACEALPSDLTSTTNSTFTNFENQYLKEILKTNLEASYLSNVGAGSIGSGNVRRIQIGGSFSVAGYKKADIVLESNSLRIPDLPNVGVGLSPALTLDLNIGWVLGFEEKHWLRKMGVFLHGMQVAVHQGNFQKANPDSNSTGRVAMKNFGATVRYRILDKQGFFLNSVVWNGLNLGVGHHQSQMDLDISYRDESATKVETRGLQGRWGGSNDFGFFTKSRTTNVDVRTGIGLFWVMDLVLGAGYAWNTGDSSVSLNRSGPFAISPSGAPLSDLPSNFSTTDPNLGRGVLNGELGLSARGNSNVRRNLGYGIVGLEFDIYLVKVIFEGIYGGKDLYSANAGVKISL